MIEFKDFEPILNHLNKQVWANSVPDKVIYEIAKNYHQNLSKEYSKNRTLVRLAGQSGSGKTTQLLPATKKLFEEKNMNPIHFCIRNFAPLHPEYEELIKKFGKGEIREKTNGFALKCFTICLAFALQDGLDVIFEVTLLTNEFEEYVNNLLKKFGYKDLYFCLAVNKEISDYFIAKRKANLSSAEGSRVVYKSSSDFFYEALAQAIKYLSQTHPNDRIIIWNAYDLEPKYDGKMGDCFEVFDRERGNKSKDFADEGQLLDAKINYIIKNC